jgi:Fe-S-cluster containining protein
VIIPADCEKCGECCHSDTVTFVPLNPEDKERLGDEWADLTQQVDGQTYMKMQGGACVALDASQGLSRCSIYDARPEVCREFLQSSPECRSVLVDAGRLRARARERR